MRAFRARLAALALVSGMTLSSCASDMYGDPYGYGGVSVGYGYSGYGYPGYDYSGYGYPGYGYGYSPYYGYGFGYGYGYGTYDPFGWYGDSYYPGVGIYVYDRYRNRHLWSSDQQRYWTNRNTRWQHRFETTTTNENWSGWNRSNVQGRSSNTDNSQHHWRGPNGERQNRERH